MRQLIASAGVRMAAGIALKAGADVLSKGVTLIVTIAAARLLAPAEFGVFALAMTTGWILGVASDAGLPMFLARRVARAASGGRARAFTGVAHVMRVRAGTGLAAAAAGLVAALVVAPPPMVAAFVLIVAAQLLQAVLETLAHAYRGLGRSDIEAWLVIGYRTAIAIAAVAVLAGRPTLWGLSLALAVPTGAALVISLAVARRLMNAPRETDAGDLLVTPARFSREIAPLGAAVLLSAIYFRCDVYFIERWHGLDAVGQYNAAFRIVEALRLFPAAALAVVFPRLCNARDPRPLVTLTTALGAGGCAMLAAVYLAAGPLLDLTYGARFVEAAPALRVLAFALPLFFVNYALTHQVIAWDGPRAFLAIAAGALVVNLAGNGWLIPALGITGAAVSTLVTELAVSAGSVVALARMRSVRPPTAASSGGAGHAAAAMAAPVPSSLSGDAR